MQLQFKRSEDLKKVTVYSQQRTGEWLPIVSVELNDEVETLIIESFVVQSKTESHTVKMDLIWNGEY